MSPHQSAFPSPPAPAAARLGPVYPSAEVAASRHLAVTYRNTPTAGWRCERYSLAHGPIAQGGLCLLLAMLLMAAVTKHRVSNLVTACLCAGFIIGFFYVGTYALLSAKFDRTNGVRDCTTILTKSGVYDMTPDGATFHAWGGFSQIRDHDGDVYFWTSGAGVYIPREAFESREESYRFADAALLLNKSRGREWETILPPLSSAARVDGSDTDR